MSSRIDTAVHTKAFDDPVAEHWGKAEMFSPARTLTDNTIVYPLSTFSGLMWKSTIPFMNLFCVDE